MKRICTRGLISISAVALASLSVDSLAARTITVPIIVHNQARPEIAISDRFEGADANDFVRAEAAATTALRIAREGVLLRATDEVGIRALTESALDGDLLALEVPDDLTLDAWLATDLPHGSRYYSAVPLIDEAMIAAPGGLLSIYNLDRGSAALRVVSFGAAAATCTASTDLGSASFSADRGRQVSFEAFATRTPQEALRVSCDQPFYAFGTVFDGADGRLTVVGPSSRAPISAVAEAGLPPLSLAFEKLGLVHAPSKECGPTKKGVVKMPVGEERQVARTLAVLDIFVGSWHKANSSGVHSPFWLHRDNPAQPFRSNSIMNLNFGGTKNFLKWNSNLDQPPSSRGGTVFKAQGTLKLIKGSDVQLQVIHDAVDKIASATVFNDGGEIVRRIEGKASGFKQQLLLDSRGTKLEIGHFCGQHKPEVPFPGGKGEWEFSNFRAEFFLKETKEIPKD